MVLQELVYPFLSKEKLIEWMDQNLDEIRDNITESMISKIHFNYSIDPEDTEHRTITIDFWRHNI